MRKARMSKPVQGFKVLRAADPTTIGGTKPLALAPEAAQPRSFDNAPGGLRRVSSTTEIRDVAENSAKNLLGALSKNA